MAVSKLASITPEPSERALAQQLNKAIDPVAAKLVNTRSVCKASYIHPAVFADFREGRLAKVMKLRKTSYERLRRWMDEDEISVLMWLRKRSSISG